MRYYFLNDKKLFNILISEGFSSARKTYDSSWSHSALIVEDSIIKFGYTKDLKDQKELITYSNKKYYKGDEYLCNKKNLKDYLKNLEEISIEEIDSYFDCFN